MNLSGEMAAKSFSAKVVVVAAGSAGGCSMRAVPANSRVLQLCRLSVSDPSGFC